jgi:hypothetical protein
MSAFGDTFSLLGVCQSFSSQSDLLTFDGCSSSWDYCLKSLNLTFFQEMNLKSLLLGHHS